MSCTVFAIPYAIAWIAGTLITSIASGTIESSNNNTDSFMPSLINSPENISDCEDVHVIDEKCFLNKNLETAFMDKEILLKTLEEHGVRGLKESEFGRITCDIDNFSLTFEKPEENKPYFLNISYLDENNADEKLSEISSEYALNVQEDVYLNMVEKLKANNMEIEDEEVLDDNTIVLTVNLD